uniref:Glycosyltransferase n=1 Tax=viral metagenome TaxID=1070528 RepID=A0A6M3KIL8_9ZZZZ
MVISMSKPLLFYDIGELGWSIPLSAHINYLLINNSNIKIVICTSKDRFVLYNGLKVKLISVPEKILNKIKDLDQDGTHLYNHKTKERITNDILYDYFNDYFGDKYEVSKEYGEFFNERVFYRFKSSEESKITVMNLFKNNEIILVFPRRRKGKFGNRNLTKKFYINLCVRLCRDYPFHSIVSIGSKNGSYYLYDEISNENFVDFSYWDDEQTLDIFIAMCNYCKVKFAVGAQSSLPKISLLCGVPTFIIGHQKERHTVDDNWFKTKVEFYNVDFADGKYRVNNHSECINKIIEFGNLKKPIVLEDYLIKTTNHPISSMNNDSPLLFYDVGEIGWSQHMVAFIKSYREKYLWKRIVVSTSKSKFVFYRDCCDDIVDLPQSVKENLNSYEPEQHFLFDINRKAKLSGERLIRLFKETFPQCDIFDGFNSITNVGRKFYRPYISSRNARIFVKNMCRDKQSILIFPRKRKGIYGARNLSLDFCKHICEKLRQSFKDHLIISVGSINGGHALGSVVDFDLVEHNNDETIDILVALCNLRKSIFTIGAQSGLSKISLLCGIPSFIIGHERERHTINENWAETNVEFFDAQKSNDGYIFDENRCLENIINFGHKIEEGFMK